MQIGYKLLKNGVVRIDDIYWVALGGFTVNPTRVSKVAKEEFSYGNSQFSSKCSLGNLSCDGIVEKVKGNRIEWHVRNGLYGETDVLKLINQNVKKFSFDKIVYSLHKPGVAEEGDIFWGGFGGFPLQPARVFKATETSFSYSNEKFSLKYDSKSDFFDGILEKKVGNNLARYVSADVLDKVREIIPYAEIVE